MKSCCLCKKKQIPGGGTFFRVPKDEFKRDRWKEVCKIEFSKNAVVCIDHFSPSSFRSAGRNTLLMPDAVPVVM